MKAILLALSLAAVVMTVVGFALRYTRPDPRGHGRWRDPGLMPPSSVPVLSGGRDGLEMLFKRRFDLPERARFTDRALSHRLGLETDRWAYFELWVANRGAVPVTIDPATLELEDAEGEPVAVHELRSLVRKVTPERRTLLALHAPRSDRPLESGRFRRLLVALPREVAMERLSRARLAGVELGPGRGARDEIQQYHERPGDGSLLAVMEPPEAGPRVGPAKEDDR